MAQTIGEAAGVVRKYLHENGPATTTRMTQDLRRPREDLQRAIGWLAREDKLNIEQANGAERISLK